jgi:hypothetical protein
MELGSLRGVQPKTATAIMSVVFPIVYGIIDFHVEHQLGSYIGEGSLEKKATNCAKILFEMRRVARDQMDKHGGIWTTRMVDMSLFALDLKEIEEEDAEIKDRTEMLSYEPDPEAFATDETFEYGEEIYDDDYEEEDDNERKVTEVLPFGYEDILHPEGEGDYDSDNEGH